jgi:hypothetical protein
MNTDHKSQFIASMKQAIAISAEDHGFTEDNIRFIAEMLWSYHEGTYKGTNKGLWWERVAIGIGALGIGFVLRSIF